MTATGIWPADDPAWEPRALTVETDPGLGGRWTSLRSAAGDRGPEREWLWSNPDPEVAAARAAAGPGAAFVDVGGVEECFPTVRGEPDHGAAWSRPWTAAEGGHRVRAGALGLARRMRADGSLTVDYAVTGPPGTPFVHAVHALLDLSPAARLHVPGIRTVHVLDHPVDGAVAVLPWPAGPGGTPLDLLGPDDGTAVAAVLPGCSSATVVDGPDALVLRWRVTAGDPAATCSLLLWRNLGGWPEARPYRSIGVEPMVGTTATLDGSGPGRPATTGPDGRLRWELTITAWRRT
ncbi:hypothetical protein ACQPWY_12560 [Pseudonocardia xinjiangensis]|uniref:hypothetical protein n=1 Tax=Pseudonocardia xinjiangensis TaxID=75289 RepID=UPI003D8EF776